MKPGKAFLIGAGPGDPELLTLKAVRALGAADVVLLDELVNREVLRFMQPQARVIEVGKRGGCRSTPQAFINRLMVRLARRGHVVARLKGGDPFVFGRGGEELAALCQAGIDVEVVCGITAGIGAAAALGVPLTHRDCVHGVTFITGHTHAGAAINWAALAAGGTTLVIYMGMARLAATAAQLQDAGMPPSTPAAVIEHGTLPSQRSLVTTLAALEREVAEHGLGSPAVVVIGEVVNHMQPAALRELASRAA